MVKCAFCGKEEQIFRGVNRIRNDGNVDFFCSGKCRKSSVKLHRDKRVIKWTESYRVALAKSKEKARLLGENKVVAPKVEVKKEAKAKK
ncbi:MAG: hypothetical protein AABX66_03095 [Nanoarchaeota archaeon]